MDKLRFQAVSGVLHDWRTRILNIFLAVMVWFESMIWMVILGIRAIILKIKNRKKGR